ncbi:hypothetical protein SAMN03097699_0773 [Flavobacteriaceae bacterium MAR_2010_188]|nr:hypothetical protein SAMN03097699_0773 [Flavobacteriaceae bacterium MAR_2010_188]
MKFDKQTAAEAGKISSRRGISNKSTKELRDRVQKLIDDNWETLLEDISELGPKERIDTVIRMLDYVLPKLTRSEIEQKGNIWDYNIIDLDKGIDPRELAKINKELEEEY